MKTNWRRYFYFSRTERNGIIILGIIILILLTSGIWLPWFQLDKTYDFSGFEKEIAELEKNQSRDSIAAAKYFESHKKEWFKKNDELTKATFHPFPFNPNNLSVEKWQKIGLADWKIQIIKKYEAKGGEFYKKDDLKKIYGITEKEFALLEPYIVLPKDSSAKFKKEIPTSSVIKIIDINIADTSDFRSLKGIGSAYAKRIVKYRTLLGGFTNTEQLLEVYGMDSARYYLFSKYLVINPSIIKKININTATIKDLNAHPYIDYFVAKSIIEYRKKHGKYTSVEEIRKSRLIYGDLFNKIAPYLTVN